MLRTMIYPSSSQSQYADDSICDSGHESARASASELYPDEFFLIGKEGSFVPYAILCSSICRGQESRDYINSIVLVVVGH